MWQYRVTAELSKKLQRNIRFEDCTPEDVEGESYYSPPLSLGLLEQFLCAWKSI